MKVTTTDFFMRLGSQPPTNMKGSEGLGWGWRLRQFAKESKSRRHVAMKGRLACDCHGASSRHGVAKRSSPSMPADRQLVDTTSYTIPLSLVKL